MKTRLKAFLNIALAMMLASKLVANESTNYQSSEESNVFLAQAQVGPSSALRSPSSPNVGFSGANDSMVSPAAPPVRANINDVDLSRQLAPTRSTNSLSQFASTNRSTGAFRPTNIFGDFFGSQGSQSALVIPITYKAVRGTNVGSGVYGFSVTGTNGLDVFASGNPNGPNKLNVLEPLNPSGAFIPSADGIANFRFGGGTATQLGTNNIFDVTYFYTTTSASVPSSTTSLVGRQKIAENVSPIPQNRLFASYSYFDRTQLGGGTDVRRWAPGFESLLLGDNTSIEMRLPMAVTLSSTTFADSGRAESYEVGNLYVALKRLIYRSDQSAISIGTCMTLPTGNDINVFVRSRTFGQRQILKIQNESVHVLPFVGWYRGNDRVFTQGFAQVDIDTNGNSVLFNPDFQRDQLQRVGRLQDANFMYLDVQSGYWLRRLKQGDFVGKSRNGFTGISAVTELHWNRSLKSEDNVLFPSAITLGTPRGDVQVVNALIGMNFEHNFRTNVSVGYATPIGNGADHEFKGEGRLLFNRYY